MAKYKYEKRDVSGYYRQMYGKKYWTNPYKRRQLIRVDDKTKEKIKKGKARKLISGKERLVEYKLFNDLAPFSREELLELAYINKLKLPYNPTRSNIIDMLLNEAEKRRIKNLLTDFNKREIIHFADYLGRHTIQRDYKTKADLIEFLSANTHEYNLHEYVTRRDEIKEFSNDKKFLIRELRENTTSTENRIKKLVGEELIVELLTENLIYIHNVDRKGKRNYGLTLDGYKHIDAFDHLYKDVQIPNYQSMEKVISPEIINSVKQLAKNRREYSIGLDFERELKNPQQIVAIQGAESFTYHLQDDFEMFGHTHPSRENAIPSKNDLINMRIERPDFIVAGKTGKAIILNIENDEWYRYWKETSYSSPSGLDLNKKEDRDIYFRRTGVRIYPYRKGMKVTLIDDPTLEKGFPFFSAYGLDKIHSAELENISKPSGNKNG